MIGHFYKWFRKIYNKLARSIAFLPAVMGLGFLLLAVITLELDGIGLGFKISMNVKWLTLKDAETARTIVATVAAGIISLTVFSFSMVMIVMNQAATQMSNRMLDNIIGDRVQRVVLGFYIGTIMFALFLLINISKTENALTVPSFSIYFLLLLTVLDIFIFIYFLHYITQSFRYEQLIQRIHNRTIRSLKNINTGIFEPTTESLQSNVIYAPRSGYFQNFDHDRLLKFANGNNIVIRFLHHRGTYLLEGVPLLETMGRQLNPEQIKELLINIDFYHGQEIDNNPYYGFQHLADVALKALSPGINDPGTAVLVLNSLSDLFLYIMKNPITENIAGDDGKVRVIVTQLSFVQLFEQTILPIWDYGKNDRRVRTVMERMLQQMMDVYSDGDNMVIIKDMLGRVKGEDGDFGG